MITTLKQHADHWYTIFEDLWSILIENPSPFGVNPTAPDVSLCCSDGKVNMHRHQLKKFTVLLDLEDIEKLPEYLTDPWGHLTLILPNLKIEVLLALGRLIYCGDSGNLSHEAMQEIVRIIRPEFGGCQDKMNDINDQEKSGNEMLESSDHQTNDAFDRKDSNEGTDIIDQTIENVIEREKNKYPETDVDNIARDHDDEPLYTIEDAKETQEEINDVGQEGIVAECKAEIPLCSNDTIVMDESCNTSSETVVQNVFDQDNYDLDVAEADGGAELKIYPAMTKLVTAHIHSYIPKSKDYPNRGSAVICLGIRQIQV